MDQVDTEASTPDEDVDPQRRPRPEAKALRWDELLPPTQTAMREVIQWLDAALSSSQTKGPAGQGSTPPSLHEQLATSVLVAGDRGFGKTTILMTLADALRNPIEFLAPKENTRREPGKAGPTGMNHPLYPRLRRLSQNLVLLTPLDMEPLPTEANLLATLLVRVRDALSNDPSSSEQKPLASPMLLEEGVDEPWGQINQLVQDATFMWEDIPVQGQDPRQRAEYQLRAAELYARFQSRLYKALESVSRFLARRRYGHDDTDEAGVILLLPIDNVDRSIQHLHLILKLTRMVASRRLWFLLAAGRQEFQLFLEKTFHKELTESGRMVLAPGNLDQTLAIARRQAAAAMRRVLPPAHRVEIQSLRPEQTWVFKAPASLIGNEDHRPRLCELLDAIPLPGVNAQGRSFAALFDIHKWMEPQGAEREPEFTEAAQLALTTSARTALDLWQAALSAYQHNPPQSPLPGQTSKEEEDERAIDIAHRMLLMSIDESDLPGWASEQLLHRVIRLDVRKHVVLDLTGMPIRRLKRTVLTEAIGLTPLTRLDTSGNRVLRSDLHVRHAQSIILELHDLGSTGRKVPLPWNVAGWFMLLHDLLMSTRERRVWNIQVMPLDVMPELVVSQHEAQLHDDFLFELNLWWIPPEWEQFIDSALFLDRWKDCIQLSELTQTGSSASPSDTIAFMRYILAVWIDSACLVALDARDDSSRHIPGTRLRLATLLKSMKAISEETTSRIEEALGQYESQVVDRVKLLIDRQSTFGYDRIDIALRWLTHSLPLMLGPDFLPDSITNHLRERLQDTLNWNPGLIRRRRFEMIRAVIQRSDAYKRQEELFNRSTGPGALEARRFLLESCEAWLRILTGPFDTRGAELETSGNGATKTPSRAPKPASKGAKTLRPHASGKVSRPGKRQGPAPGGKRGSGAPKRRR